MGYVFDFNDAMICEKWFLNSQNQAIADSQYHLMLEMLKAHPGQCILDIGCGLGKGLSFCHEKGMRVTGIDPSPYMLDIAKKNLGDHIELHRGKAENLPFDDNSFNYASLITSLEFVDDPQKALEEACRVAKDKIFIGIINRYTFKRFQYESKDFLPIPYTIMRLFLASGTSSNYILFIGRCTDSMAKYSNTSISKIELKKNPLTFA
jgi:ubiquinone/menaquinone biosynthesis C-methylase UbiE